MIKRFILSTLIALVSSGTLAQWQVPNGSIPVGRGTGVIGFNSVAGSSGIGSKCLIDTNPPTFAGCTASVTVGTTSIVNGNSNGVLYNNSGVLGNLVAGTNGQILVGASGSPPQMAAMSQDCTITNTGVITCLRTNNVLFSTLATLVPGTGVGTALGVNVGTAGAFIVNGGALGTPASGTLTNATGLPTSSLVNQLQAAQVPAFAGGDVTSAGGSLVLSVAANAITNAKFATMAAFTIKANATGSAAVPTDVSIPALTQKVTPAGTDKVMLADSAASDALKYVTVSALATASGVSSIAGNTGAFTLGTGLTNSVNDIRLSVPVSIANGGSGVTSSAAWALLNTLTASSSANLADTTSLTSTYNEYVLVFENLIPATNLVTCQIQVNSIGVQTTGYLAQEMHNSGTTVAGNSSTTYIPCSPNLTVANTVTGVGVSGSITVFNPSQNATPKHWRGSFSTAFTAANLIVESGGFWNSNGSVTGFQVSFSSGNITSGVIKVYGVK